MGQHQGGHRFELENKHLKRQTHFYSSLFVALTRTPLHSSSRPLKQSKTPLQPLFLSCSLPSSAFCALRPRRLWADHEPKTRFSQAENSILPVSLLYRYTRILHQLQQLLYLGKNMYPAHSELRKEAAKSPDDHPRLGINQHSV